MNLIDVCALCAVEKADVESAKMAADEKDVSSRAESLKEWASQADIDSYFEQVVQRALSSRKTKPRKSLPTTKFGPLLRTYLVCAWILWYPSLRFPRFDFSNLGLYAVVSRVGPASVFRRIAGTDNRGNEQENYEFVYFQFVMNMTSLFAIFE